MIRPFNLRDSLRLQKLIGGSAPLELERYLTQPVSPLWAAIGAPLPWLGTGAATYLLHADARNPHSGFIQAVKRLARPEADITCIAPRYELDPNAPEIWQRLLEHVVSEAGNHGVHRLYISIADDDQGYELLCKSGFTPYIRETLYRLECLPNPTNEQALPEAVRPQCEQDSFALQRLVSRYTPQVVQKAEGMFTDSDAPAPLDLLRMWWQPEQIEGLVYEENEDILAAAHIRRGSQGHWLKLYGDPDAPEIMQALLAHSLYAFSHYNNRPLYCTLRPYQSRFGTLLEQLDFEAGPEIIRFVKHTTRFVKKSIPALSREALEASVPGLAPSETSLEQ